MDSENKNETCNCKELSEKYKLCAKEKEQQTKMIRNLIQENDELKEELRNQTSRRSDPQSWAVGVNDEYKQKYQTLLKVNHGWKYDYEQLEMRYELLKGEKKLLEEEEKELKARIRELEKRQEPLEEELGRLATALYAQQSLQNDRIDDNEEQCEMLKSQILVYKEDFDRERKDKETLQKEKDVYKRKLEESEEIIRKLTTELDACKALDSARRRGWSENGYLGERGHYYPYGPVDQQWRIEQQRRGILPRNRPSTAIFYGGDVEVDELRA